jgi:hypothetical protein
MDANAEENTIVYGIYLKDRPNIPINEVKIVTDVLLISGIELGVPSDFAPMISLEKVTEREVMVHNTGNGKDTITLSILKYSIPTDWDISIKRVKNRKTEPNQSEIVDFTKSIDIDNIEAKSYLPEDGSNLINISLILLADQTVYVVLEITSPSFGKPVTEMVKIYAESESSTIATATTDLKFTLKVSDLTITELLVKPEMPNPGKKATVKFNVTNNFHLPAEDFKVKIYKITEEGESEIHSEQISNIAPGESYAVKYSWTEPKDSSSGYTLEAHLWGEIIPTNNSPSRKKNVILQNVEPEKKKGQDNFIVMALVAAIIIALIVFISIWLLLSRKYAEPTTKESETRKDSDKFKPRSKSDALSSKKGRPGAQPRKPQDFRRGGTGKDKRAK